MVHQNLQELDIELHAYCVALRKLQREYFLGVRRGYTEPHKLQKCKNVESNLKKWLNDHWKNRDNPAVYLPHEPAELKNYLALMDKVTYLIKEQQLYYQNRDGKQLKKCKQLETDLDKYLAKVMEPAPAPTLFE